MEIYRAELSTAKKSSGRLIFTVEAQESFLYLLHK